MRKQNGITLIALVVTIIVLLLLAGVSITLLIDDNGVLTQATKAVSKTRKAQAEEEVAMAWAAIESEYLTAWTRDESISKEDYYTKERFQSKFNNGSIVGDIEISEQTNSEGESTDVISLMYKANDGLEYSMKIDELGNVEGELSYYFAQKIKPSNYGDLVNYESSNGIKEWQVFYNNGENIFLIAKYYVPSGKLPTKAGLSYSNPNYWVSTAATVTWTTVVERNIDENLASKYMYEQLKNVSKTNNNYKAATMMLDTTKWDDFKDKNGYAESAIGGPTVEMWAASWNEHSNNNPEIKLTTTENGYAFIDGENQVNELSSPLKNSEIYKDAQRNGGNMYYPNTSVDYGEGAGYWFSSPSNQKAEDGTYSLLRPVYPGQIGGYSPLTSKSSAICLRPVVCLHSDVAASWSEAQQKWILE